jgi:abequosyltransferase
MKPLISICIPTYNRASLLKETLYSVVSQCDRWILDIGIEIVVSDNCSTDNTKSTVEEYQANFKYLKYFKNDNNIGMVKNLVKVATYASGEYIWFLSDDDILSVEAIKRVFKEIKSFSPGIIFCNYIGFVGSKDNIVIKNGLRKDGDEFLNDRKSFFKFLEKQPFQGLYAYLTFYSNLLIKKEYFDDNISVIEKYNGGLDLFPHEYIFFYSKLDIGIKIISEPLVYYRMDNQSWLSGKKFFKDIFSEKVVYNHYKNVYRLNNEYLSFEFRLKILFWHTVACFYIFKNNFLSRFN